MFQKIAATGAALLILAIGGCGPKYSPNTYSSGAVQQASKVEPGRIVGVRQVAVSADATVGTVTGAAAGGIAGSQVDYGGGAVTALTTLGGTVVGGIVGSGVEHATGDTTAYEYIVRQNNGDLVSVTQRDTVPLSIGQTVLVIAGKQARIVPDYTVAVPLPSAHTPSAAEAGKTAMPASASQVRPPSTAAAAPTPETPSAAGGTSPPVAAAPPASAATGTAPAPQAPLSPQVATPPGTPVSLALPSAASPSAASPSAATPSAVTPSAVTGAPAPLPAMSQPGTPSPRALAAGSSGTETDTTAGSPPMGSDPGLAASPAVAPGGTPAAGSPESGNK